MIRSVYTDAHWASVKDKLELWIFYLFLLHGDHPNILDDIRLWMLRIQTGLR